MSKWPNLHSLIEEYRLNLDQRMQAAVTMCPQDKSIHDFHILRSLYRQNAAFVRQVYASVLCNALEHMPDPGIYSDSIGSPLAGTVVPSLQEMFWFARRFSTVSSNAFLTAWASISLNNGGSPYRRSMLLKWLMGDKDTSEGSVYDVPLLEVFLKSMMSVPETPDDVQYILALENDNIVFRPVSVLNDYIQRNSLGKLVPHRSLLTHFHDSFGLFAMNQIEELEDLINNSASKEVDFQGFFSRNPHFLRRGVYREVYPHPYLAHRDGGLLVPDFILTNRTVTQAAIAELKLPRARLIRRQHNRDRLACSVLEARAQLLTYRDWFRSEPNRTSLKKLIGMEIYEPRLLIIIGRSAEFQDEVDRQRLAAENPDIEVLTYDDILSHARDRMVKISG